MGIASLISWVGEMKMKIEVISIRPEANWSNYEQVLRTELVNVAKFWDDL